MSEQLNTFVSLESAGWWPTPILYGKYKFFWYNRWPRLRYNAKLNFLWNDLLIIEDFGHEQLRDWFVGSEALTTKEAHFFDDVVVPLSSIGGGSAINARRMRYLEDPAMTEGRGSNYYNYSEPRNPHQFAYNSLVAEYEKRLGVAKLTGGDFHQAEGQASIAVDAIRTWAHLNEYLECQIFCNPDEEVALKAMLGFASREISQVSQSKLVSQVATPALPDVSMLSWSEIIAIKKDIGVAQLRERLTEIYLQHGDYDETVGLFQQEVRQLSRKIVIDSTPRPIRALVEMIATHLPMGLFNPFHIFSGYKRFISECHEAASRKWIYTFNDLEERVGNAAIVRKAAREPPMSGSDTLKGIRKSLSEGQGHDNFEITSIERQDANSILVGYVPTVPGGPVKSWSVLRCAEPIQDEEIDGALKELASKRPLEEPD